MFEIREAEGQWEIVDRSAGGDTLVRVGDLHPSYDLALAFLSGMLTLAALAEDGDEETESTDGLLPEPWAADLAFAEATGDGRDFTGVEWSARNPAESTLPLMLQTETDMGHFGAVLAGYFTSIDNLGTATDPTGAGRFYDTDEGRQLRDMLLDGRTFGVSVDPGRVDMEWECTAEDEDGYCIAEEAVFTAYEIIGVTATPFPAFARASIRLDEAVAASARTPIDLRTLHVQTPLDLPAGIDLKAPPRDWFYTAEPQLGEPFALGSLGDEWLIDQGRGLLAMPFTIGDDGRIAGHGAVWGMEHIGYGGRKIMPPPSPTGYARFHVGATKVAGGGTISVGALSASCDHAAAHLRAKDARDSYAHNGVAWANVRIVDGEHGPWISGALRHDVTQEQVAVLQAGALSGDWRGHDDGLDSIAWLAVTTPGFTIAREAITASGLEIPSTPATHAAIRGGELVSLVASGIVRRCPDCARRAAAAAGPAAPAGLTGDGPGRLAAMERTLALLERRTRHLVAPAAEHAAHRIRG